MNRFSVRRRVLGSCLFAWAAVGWLGCSSAPDSSDPLASSAQAITAPSFGKCDKVENVVYAMPHSYTSGCGFLTRYTSPFPSPTCVVPAGPDGDLSPVEAYEQEIWDNVTLADGYAYRVSQSNPNKNHNAVFYMAVGVNDRNRERAYLPPAGNAVDGLPLAADWDYEWEHTGEHTDKPVSAAHPPLRCVEVRSADEDEDVLDIFPILDIYDPLGPMW
jgi:hypothetical protein